MPNHTSPDEPLPTVIPKTEAEEPTMVYIHGIGNKPAPAVLKVQWDRALFGLDMGARTRMAYWADIRYGRPLSAAAVEAMGVSQESVRTFSIEEWDRLAPQVAPYGAEAEKLARQLGRRMMLPAAQELAPRGGRGRARGGGPQALAVEAKILPGFLRGPVTHWLTGMFIKDVAAYFYDQEQRQAMQARLRQVLVPQDAPYVMVAHSLGSVIAYDVLREITGVSVQLLITIGSPLGIAEVQDKVAQPRQIPKPVAQWNNFYDPLDPVALDQKLVKDYPGKPPVADQVVLNPDGQRLIGFNPHSAIGYLSTQPVRSAVTDKVGTAFASPVAKFVVARDLATDLAEPSLRHEVLIEVAEAEGLTLEQKVRAIETMLKKMVASVEEAEIDVLKRYVAARLTAAEVYQLAASAKGLRIQSVWRNARKKALLDVSAHTVQAYTAQLGYRATGKDVTWAVLDTGVSAGHPHFAGFANVVRQWNCTGTGAPALEYQGGAVPANVLLDGNGHGTHVAGIICGSQAGPDPKYRGMAPEAKVWSYKVLKDNGEGSDASIIKALDHIAAINETSPGLVIHGVNLSLGGSFDVTVYACGFSPICRELRRLWRQGVVVCVAAGNEGRLAVETADGEQELNLDLSIGDPANLEDSIGVGSVNKEHPHMYGISYFSSRGPTADGRVKPDLVAPGERVYSANAKFGQAGEPPYVSLSGTSMACPHVSGVLAGFLSVRREFIGHPDQVKQILLKNCTDLSRNVYHQGAGMPNLVRMLMAT